MSRLDEALAPLRRRVDELDSQLLALLNERAGTVAEIFQIKDAHGAPRFSAARTDAILERLTAANTGPLTDAELRQIFEPLLRYFASQFRS